MESSYLLDLKRTDTFKQVLKKYFLQLQFLEQVQFTATFTTLRQQQYILMYF